MSRPKTPTTLVELAYIANKDEATLIKSGEYVPAVSKALADAIEEYLQVPTTKNYPTTVRNFTAANAPGYNVCSDPELNSEIFFNFPSREELIARGLIEE